MPRRLPIGRLLEIAVFAPIGLCGVIKDQLPVIGKRVAQERQAVLNRAQLAQLAVRVAADRATRAGTVPPPPTVEPPVSSSPAPDGPGGMTSADLSVPPVSAPDPAAGNADTLPISDYESLAAIHVVHRLPTLRPDELEQVRAFERANRARRTILAKIEQLQESRS